jgi:hypothetical protein
MSEPSTAAQLPAESEPAAQASPRPVSSDPRHQAALDYIHFPWRELGFEIVFLSAKRGYRAMTFGKKKRIEIYVRPGDDARMLASDIAHELGHAIDLTYNTSATRDEWKKARGIEASEPWFGCNKCSDYKTPAGDFAETFSFLLMGPPYFNSRIAPRPTPAQIPLLAAFFPNLVVRNAN